MKYSAKMWTRLVTEDVIQGRSLVSTATTIGVMEFID